MPRCVCWRSPTRCRPRAARGGRGRCRCRSRARTLEALARRAGAATTTGEPARGARGDRATSCARDRNVVLAGVARYEAARCGRAPATAEVRPCRELTVATSAIERMLAIKAMPVFADVHPDELAVVAEYARVHASAAARRCTRARQRPCRPSIWCSTGRVTEYRGGRPSSRHGPQHVLGGEDALALSAADVDGGRGRGHAHAGDRARPAARRAGGQLRRPVGGAAGRGGGDAAAAPPYRAVGRMAGAAADRRPPAGSPLDDPGARVAFLLGATRGSGTPASGRSGQLARDAESVALRRGRASLGGGRRRRGRPRSWSTVVCSCETRRRSAALRGGRGTILGLEEALAVDTRWCGAVVREPARRSTITRAALIDVLEDDPDSALALLAALAPHRERAARSRRARAQRRSGMKRTLRSPCSPAALAVGRLPAVARVVGADRRQAGADGPSRTPPPGNNWPVPPRRGRAAARQGAAAARRARAHRHGVAGRDEGRRHVPGRRAASSRSSGRPLPPGHPDGWNNNPRKELATYEIQKWFLAAAGLRRAHHRACAASRSPTTGDSMPTP